jgi:hypothetical protein
MLARDTAGAARATVLTFDLCCVGAGVAEEAPVLFSLFSVSAERTAAPDTRRGRDGGASFFSFRVGELVVGHGPNDSRKLRRREGRNLADLTQMALRQVSFPKIG